MKIKEEKNKCINCQYTFDGEKRKCPKCGSSLVKSYKQRIISSLVYYSIMSISIFLVLIVGATVYFNDLSNYGLLFAILGSFIAELVMIFGVRIKIKQLKEISKNKKIRYIIHKYMEK